ncbi:MAG: ATP-binding protein [Rhodomicrobium sp.]
MISVPSFHLRPQLRLGTRIAATIVAAIFAVQVLNAAVFLLLPRPQMTVYGARWLIGKIEAAAQTVFAASEAERPLLAAQAGPADDLRIRWQPQADWNPPEPPGPYTSLLDRIQASLENDLKGKVQKVTVRGHGGPPYPHFRGEERYLPHDFISQLPHGPIAAGEAEIPIIGGFEIAIQGLDGSWLYIGPVQRPRLAGFLDPWFVTFVGGVILVLAFSAFTAKKSLRPLDRLVEAAQKLGHIREPVPISLAGLNEFAVIAQALNEMQGRIKQFLDERTQMLAAISHDMRTSLTRLRLEAEELPESGTKDRLIIDMEEMERMISATLTFAGDDLKREPHERVDLAALLISLCDSFSDRGQPADYSGPNHAYLLCQPSAMKRAFDNLIGNAIKYGVRARVHLSPTPGEVLVSVADDGPGIPSDQVELAFQPFRRLENSRNRESGGVGLGLAIARDIIRAHGGEIGLTNRVEGGLEVLVRLPATGTT